MFKKAQTDPKELVLTLIIVGAVAIVGLLVFSSVANTSDRIFDPDIAREINESVTLTDTTDDWGTNSTVLAKTGYISSSETVANSSDETKILVVDTDYFVLLDGTSGQLATKANYTLSRQYNDTALEISYDHNVQSEAQTSVNAIETTVLDSFELGVIALIVLAAVVILAVLFRLGQ